MAVAIVEGTLLWIGQNSVRLGTFLEFLLGGMVPGVLVRVMLDRELPIGALDLNIACGFHHTKDFVVVALAHAFATFTIAGLNSRSLIVYPLRSSPITSPSRWSGLASCTTA